ncbi:MAG: hypothetical protein ACLQVM_10315 [Terriglobia bacterium]
MKDILRVVSTQVGKTILYDTLPSDPITINVQDAKLEDILKIAIARYPSFRLGIFD